MTPLDPRSEQKLGIAYGLAAFLAWGLLPIYWRHLKHVAALEVLCHRVVWNAIFVFLLLLIKHRVDELRPAIRDPRTRRTFILCSVLIGGNWLVFIWAVQNGRVLQASMGYFLSPLMSVLLGRVILKERLDRPQSIAVGLAALGVFNLIARGDEFPYIAMWLVVSFGLYSVLRKTARLDAMLGLVLESAPMVPLAFFYLIYLQQTTGDAFTQGSFTTRAFLIGAGPVTALPLLWFAHCARRLRLTMLGFFQYISPTLQFLLGVFYGEAFTAVHGVSFALIWLGLGVYTARALRLNGHSNDGSPERSDQK